MNIAVENIKEIEKFLINNGNDISNKKLQKLLYYAQAWFITINNESSTDIENVLFSANIEAWRHGPVVAESYRRYKNWGYKVIQDEDDYNLDKNISEFLGEVLSEYDRYSADQLESISHQEDPWRNCFIKDSNTIISPNEMFDYYIRQSNG